MQRPSIRPYACGVLILLFTIVVSAVTIATIILLLMLLFHCYYHITVTTDKVHQVSSFSGVVELTTQLLRLINLLFSPCVESINLGLLRRLLRSPTLVGHQGVTDWQGTNHVNRLSQKLNGSLTRHEIGEKLAW